ncbi:DNA sulfur modification protein DndB [Candidatus Manganitrophus noduliformans]|uniref:DNA sulfur modification protein DndB n=1 Tax=Candidatus Manganitrophus noduliformans TaxID=2606439 RepID=A0A7X6DN21_9BACT|nr:DNA sulfur modification protein DndB [Candidatus Manganitrophus noduliformans]NKE70127.1 DNA sulfur modification protein DndB [Candidatus Manganitrophus noduliformans]
MHLEPENLSDSFSYVFSALRGIQAGREYFVAMCPLNIIPKIFLFDEGEIPPNLRAQRSLNRTRIPEISQYIIENPKEYVFSSITASIDRDVSFEPFEKNGPGKNVGQLKIPMTAKFILNDGQHRRAAIEEALKERPGLGEETISVVFFIDKDLQRSQQMFADLNQHAVRPTKSLGILYDHRDPLSQLSRKLLERVSIFKGMTETEKTTISNRSIKLFTLSSIYQGTRALLNKPTNGQISSQEEALAIDFWTEISKYIPEWQLAQQKEVSAAELRRDYIHAHGIALHTLGIVGSSLIAAEPKRWKERLKLLTKVDWSRSNTRLWEGRAMIGGRVSKAHNNVILTAAALKLTLELPLSPEEKKVDSHFKKRGG